LGKKRSEPKEGRDEKKSPPTQNRNNTEVQTRGHVGGGKFYESEGTALHLTEGGARLASRMEGVNYVAASRELGGEQFGVGGLHPREEAEESNKGPSRSGEEKETPRLPGKGEDASKIGPSITGNYSQENVGGGRRDT